MAIEYKTGDTLHVGDTVRLECTFTDEHGDLANPTTVTLIHTDPSSNSTTLTHALSEVTRQSTGVYYYDLTLDEAGDWQIRYVGTGTVAQADQVTLTVAAVNT